MNKNSVMYQVIVQTSTTNHDTYKVYSHELTNYCLVLNLGILDCGARNEIAIPVSRIFGYHTEDMEVI